MKTAMGLRVQAKMQPLPMHCADVIPIQPEAPCTMWT